jgi:hypothetical protein
MGRMVECSLIFRWVAEMATVVTVVAFLSHNGLVASRVTFFNVEYPILISREYPIFFRELKRLCDPNVNPFHCLMSVNIIN